MTASAARSSAAGPATSGELAQRTGTAERYAREWLEHQAVAGILSVEDAQAAPSAPPMEDELPRRTKPRRRRGGAAPEEPLQMVETQPSAESRPDGA